MIDYLYILIHSENHSYKVGISNNIHKRIEKLELDFGKINRKTSVIFSCNNRKLVENIERGIHAYLNNSAYHPINLGGGSSEWFEINSLEQCFAFVQLYSEELNEFKKEGNLNEFLNRKVDYVRKLETIEESSEFMRVHSEVIQKVSDFLKSNIDSIKVEKIDGSYYVSCDNIENINIGELPTFQWIRKLDNKLMFDARIFNKWKKSRTYEVHRGLIELKFFSEFRWSNVKSMLERE